MCNTSVTLFSGSHIRFSACRAIRIKLFTQKGRRLCQWAVFITVALTNARAEHQMRLKEKRAWKKEIVVPNDIVEVSVNIMSELEWTLYFMSSLEIESRVLRYETGSFRFFFGKSWTILTVCVSKFTNLTKKRRYSLLFHDYSTKPNAKIIYWSAWTLSLFHIHTHIHTVSGSGNLNIV